MNAVSVIFEGPEHGWLTVDIGTPTRTVRRSVSDVPGDTLHELVIALHRLAAGSCEERVEWSLEPDVWEWRFRVEDGELTLRAVDSRDDLTSSPLPIGGALRHLYRSLRQLESEPAWSRAGDASASWSWPFPSSALAKFGAAIER